MATTRELRVMDYTTGERLGRTVLSAEDAAAYAAGTHPAYQWPEGLAQATDVLTEEEIEALGITGRTVIWLED